MAQIDTSTIVPSLVRTYTPMIVGVILSWPLADPILQFLGISPERASNLLVAAVAGLLMAVYYGLVRLGEKYLSPAIGWFLLLAKQPAAYAVDGDNVVPGDVVGSRDDLKRP